MSPADSSSSSGGKPDDTGCSTTSFQTPLSTPASAPSGEMTTDDGALRLLPPPLPPRSSSPVMAEDATKSVRRKRFVLPPLVDPANQRTEYNTVPRINAGFPDPVKIHTPTLSSETRNDEEITRRVRHSMGSVTADTFYGETTHPVESASDRRTGGRLPHAGSPRNIQQGGRPVRYSVDSRNLHGKGSLSSCSADHPPVPEPRGQVLVPPPLTVPSRHASPSLGTTPRPDRRVNERLQESSEYTELTNPDPSGPPLCPSSDPPTLHDPEDAASSASLIASTDTLLDETKSFKSANIHYYVSELCSQGYQFNSARRDEVLRDNESEEHHHRNSSIMGITVVNANTRPYLMITLIIFLILFIILLFVFIGLLVTALI